MREHQGPPALDRLHAGDALADAGEREDVEDAPGPRHPPARPRAPRPHEHRVLGQRTEVLGGVVVAQQVGDAVDQPAGAGAPGRGLDQAQGGPGAQPQQPGAVRGDGGPPVGAVGLAAPRRVRRTGPQRGQRWPRGRAGDRAGTPCRPDRPACTRPGCHPGPTTGGPTAAHLLLARGEEEQRRGRAGRQGRADARGAGRQGASSQPARGGRGRRRGRGAGGPGGGRRARLPREQPRPARARGLRGRRRRLRPRHRRRRRRGRREQPRRPGHADAGPDHRRVRHRAAVLRPALRLPAVPGRAVLLRRGPARDGDAGAQPRARLHGGLVHRRPAAGAGRRSWSRSPASPARSTRPPASSSSAPGTTPTATSPRARRSR